MVFGALFQSDSPAWLRDAALVALAIGSAVILMIVRRLVTNQELLQRVRKDEHQLRSLIADAARRGDREAMHRYRSTRLSLRWLRVRQDFRTIVISLAAFFVLLPWAKSVFTWLPPQENQPVTFRVRLPISSVGQLAHLIPRDGLKAESGWIQVIEADESTRPIAARASWILRGRAREKPYALSVRLAERSYEHPLHIGGWRAIAQHKKHNDLIESEVVLTPYRPFGFNWLVAYSVIVCACYFGLCVLRASVVKSP